MSYRLLTMLLVMVAASATASASDLYVGGEGSHRFASIQAAIKAAKPGDTIHLDPAASPYREAAVFKSVSGTPDQPITLDGHGATLLGSDPVDPAQWIDQGDGLWRSTALADQLNVKRSVLSRFYFVFDDSPQYMGGASKHRHPTFKAPATLKPGEWTYVESEQAFYLRIAADRSLEDAGVEVPVRSAGVALQGSASHIIVRNLVAKHAWNDGFNIHGQCHDILFENVEAIECGDDGISAHGQCEIRIDGMVSRGNSNGICHVNESRSVSRNVRIEDSRAYDLYLLNESKHEFHDLTIIPSGARGTVFTSNTEVMISDATVGTDGAANQLRVRNGALVTIRNSRLLDTHLSIQDASTDLSDVVITGDHAAISVDQARDWRMQDCVWKGRELTHNGQSFEPDDLAGFRQSIERVDGRTKE